jgi:predicted ATPase/DNA-binding SARP family transcriptional activator
MLGPLRLIRGDQTLTRFGTQKAAALLAFLALRPGPHPRETVIDAFWPDMDLSAGRNNLNTALSALRHILEPAGVRKGAVLVTSHAHVGLAAAAVTTDIGDFERLLAQAARSETSADRADLLGRALALYGGDFQPGNYQDWAVRESERLQARRVEALNQQSDDLEALGLFAKAAEATRLRLETDPYEETAHVGLIRRLVRSEQLGAARDAADRFERFFREEFGSPLSAVSRKTLAELLPLSLPAQGSSPKPAAHRRSPAPPTPESPPRVPSVPMKVETTGTAAPSLPFWLSRFFGRETELAYLAAMLLSQKNPTDGPEMPLRPCRLVTLVGPGGAGKTRVSVEFARQATERFGYWCAFVPLADLTTPEQIPPQIAQSLRLPPAREVRPLDQITSFLRERDRPGAPPPLLILDNLEHLLEADERTLDAPGQTVIETVQTLLQDAPGLIILTTSRHRLGIKGERIVPVGPLPIPDVPDDTAGPDSLAGMLGVPSVRLYVDRAQAVRPDFGLTVVNAPAIAALCRMLEGSPLALELAASWVRLIPPRKMWERLAQGQTLPEGRHSDLPNRHRSLSAALDWSWRLLTERQRRLLSQVSVFRGGWTSETAESVCEDPDALSLLADLHEASLVMATETESGETRYGLLETVRQYASERLRDSGEEERTRSRHIAHFLAMAEEGEQELLGPDQKVWLERLEIEHDNLRTALDSCKVQSDAAEQGLRLSAALGKFWRVRGYLTEGLTRLHDALARTAKAAPAIRANALYEAGAIANYQGDHKETRRLLEECLEIRRGIGDRTGCAGPLRMLGIVARQRGDYDAARTYLTESLSLYQEAGDNSGAVGTITSLGNLAMADGDLEAAQALYTQSLPLYRTNADRRGTAVALGNLGNVASARGEHVLAKEQLRQALDIYAELGDSRSCAITQHSQSVVAIKLGDNVGAMDLLRQCLKSYRKLGDRQSSIGTLEALVTVWTRTGRSEPAAHLLAATSALQHEFAIKLTLHEQEEREWVLGQLGAALGKDEFAAAKCLGQLMTWEETIEYALQDSVPEKEST